MTNCPNCGAPIRGVECEYCGTSFRGLRAAVPSIIDDICELDALVNHGVMTVNDAREMNGLQRLEEERHELACKLIKARTQLLSNTDKANVLYRDVIEAMRRYAN